MRSNLKGEANPSLQLGVDLGATTSLELMIHAYW